MPHSCRNSLLCLLLISIPVTGSATSRIKDADAVITMRNGEPCFSYPQDEEIRKRPFSFGGLSVSKNGPQSGVLWVIDVASPDGKGVLEPNSPGTCIEYGVLPSWTKVVEPAKPLQMDTPYNMLLVVYSRSEGTYYERKYLSDFCISRNGKGEPILVGASGDGKGAWHCLEPGESPKRGFWQRLLAK